MWPDKSRYPNVHRDEFKRAADRRWWREMDATWSAIGLAIVVRHNLLVLTLAESVEIKESAAKELSDVIGGLLYGAMVNR